MTTILALESSCDETAASVMQYDDQGVRILAENIHAQIEQHSLHGGVVPEIAARAHLQNFPSLITDTLDQASTTIHSLDAIACTTGPGLIGGLLVGSMIARAIALRHNLDFYGIHHLEGHMLSPRLDPEKRPEFPYVALLASGGHTLICIVEAVGKYRILGRSRDDALGEAFDKSSIIMGLSYPGGPILENLARDGDHHRFTLPTPLVSSRERVDREGCEFSFSGLKTAVTRLWKALPSPSEAEKVQAQKDMAAAFHIAVKKILCNRLRNALSKFRNYYPNIKVPTVVFVGGVAANTILRNSLQCLCHDQNVQFSTVPLKLCTDNATMIGWAALERIHANILPNPDFAQVRPRWGLEC